MRFREVLFVVILLVAGLVIYEIETGGSGGSWGITFDEDGEFLGLGHQYAFEEAQTFDAPLPARLDVVNSHGWVEVRGGEQESIQLTFKKQVRRRTEADARETASQIHFSVAKSGDRWTFSANRADFRRKGFQTGFILTVPRRMSVTVTNSYGQVIVEKVKDAAVENSHGRVSASEISGPCTLETSYEEVRAVAVSGDCRIINAHADVQAGPVSGDLHIESRYGEIGFDDIGGRADIAANNATVRARRVKGPVSIETTYEKVWLTDVGPAKLRVRHGAVEADGVHGDLDVQTSYEPVRASNVQGNLLVTGSNVEVEASDIGGREISITTSYEKVELSGFSAKLALTDRNGNIILRPTDLKFPMDVQDQYGSIDFYWPDGATSSLEARSKGGSVKWGLAEKPSVDKTNGVSLIQAFGGNANAADIVLATSYGDIRIEPGHQKL